MQVRDIMTTKVESVGPESALGAAARRMRDDNLGSIMVVEDDRLVGVLTARDIVVRALTEGIYREDLPVGRAMSVTPISCLDDQTVEEAERCMAEHGVRRLPVIDHTGRLVGVLSRSDIVGAAAGRQSWRVTFYKRIATPYGDVRNVPQFSIYVSDCANKEEAAIAALARVPAERGGKSWDEFADGYEVVGPA